MSISKTEKRDCLKAKRLEKELTQSELADAVGVSIDHIKSLEYGRVNPSFKLMKKICSVLDGKMEEIF
ncbi:anaerobic benzoate catabolism transcriptional regulator [compost metagenome]